MSRVGFCGGGGARGDKITMYTEYRVLKKKRDSLFEEIAAADTTISDLQTAQDAVGREISKTTAIIAKSSSSIYMTRQLLKSSEMDLRILAESAVEGA